MSTIYNKITAKLKALDEYINYLKALQKVNRKSFLQDYIYLGAAEHYLHLSIEALVDIADLIIIDQQLPRPEERKEVFFVLGDKKILSESLLNKFTGMTGFRNVLVHEYEKVDKRKVYDNLQSSVDQFQEFKRQIARFLKKKRR